MILVEGCDGAGKTTLIYQLQKATMLPLHARASDSIQGPVKNIYSWAHHDIVSWGLQPLSIYDRHPMISEPIYGPIIRGVLPPGFKTQTGEKLKGAIYAKALLILCLPNFDVVSKNVLQQDQMPGVLNKLLDIHQAYGDLLKTIPLHAKVVVHDYTDPYSFHNVARAVDQHIVDWKSSK